MVGREGCAAPFSTNHINSERADILMGIPGGDFEQAWQNRNEIDFDGLVVPFISRQDLINSKKASGRPQDLIDADLLSKTKPE